MLVLEYEKYYFLKKETTPFCIFLRPIILSIFSYAYHPFVCLLWRNIYPNLLPIFSSVVFVLSYESSLCILDIRPLSDYMIYKTLLPFCGLSFSLSCWGPWKHKSFILTETVYLFIDWLIACAFAVKAKKPLPNPKPQGFIFYSKIFTVLDLKF